MRAPNRSGSAVVLVLPPVPRRRSSSDVSTLEARNSITSLREWPDPLGVRAHLHAGLDRARAGGHEHARALDLDDAHPARVHRREVLGVAQRRRVHARGAAGVQDRRALGHADRSRRRSRGRSVRGGGSSGTALMRSPPAEQAERARSPTGPRSRPSGRARRSRRPASRRDVLRAGRARRPTSRTCGPRTSRCSASSWRTVPTRQGTHWPQDSSRKNRAIRRTRSTRSTDSSNTMITPEPSV